MTTIDSLRALALSFPEVIEAPHFEKISFRVRKKIFVTYDNKKKWATIKLSVVNQDVFVSGSQFIHPVDNKWGKQGWTYIEMQGVHPDLFTDAITTAYCEIAPKKLAKLVRPNEIS